MVAEEVILVALERFLLNTPNNHQKPVKNKQTSGFNIANSSAKS